MNRQTVVRRAIESLENRKLLASIAQVGSQVQVVGTNSADDVIVRQDGSRLVVELNDGFRTFKLSKIKSVFVDALGGDDLVDLASTLTVRALFYGGDGRDTLRSGAGRDRLFGGNDADSLYGGSSVD